MVGRQTPLHRRADRRRVRRHPAHHLPAPWMPGISVGGATARPRGLNSHDDDGTSCDGSEAKGRLILAELPQWQSPKRQTPPPTPTRQCRRHCSAGTAAGTAPPERSGTPDHRGDRTSL